MSILALLWQWRKAIALGAVAICLSLIAWRVVAWHEAYAVGLPAAEAALKAEQACEVGTVCAQRAAEAQEKAQAVRQEITDGYEAELARVRSERPRRVVRLCPDGSGLPVSGTGPGAAGGAAPGGILPEHPGRDLGPDLYALAREADELSAQCRALIRWNRALSAQ